MLGQELLHPLERTQRTTTTPIHTALQVKSENVDFLFLPLVFVSHPVHVDDIPTSFATRTHPFADQNKRIAAKSHRFRACRPTSWRGSTRHRVCPIAFA